jgi:oligosaccharyltransferase complex subunit gamma
MPRAASRPSPPRDRRRRRRRRRRPPPIHRPPARLPARQVAALRALRAKSKDGVLTLDSAAFERFAAGKTRPYSLFLMADARQFASAKRSLHAGLQAPFAAAAKAFAAEHAGTAADGRAFFARVVFEDARDVFARLGVKALPFLGHLAPGVPVRAGGGAVALAPEDRMPAQPGPWPADVIGAFIAARTGLAAGDVAAAATPPRSRAGPLVGLALIALLARAGFALADAPLLRWPPLYALGALFVYWFSLSGGMYNIIRGVPAVGFDQRTRSAVVFSRGQGQMGAEGFIMGSVYLAFGLAVAALTRAAGKGADEAARRRAGYALLGLGFVAMRTVCSAHEWKTSLSSRWYF